MKLMRKLLIPSSAQSIEYCMVTEAWHNILKRNKTKEQKLFIRWIPSARCSKGYNADLDCEIKHLITFKVVPNT